MGRINSLTLVSTLCLKPSGVKSFSNSAMYESLMLAKLLTNVVLIAGVALGGVTYLDYKNKKAEQSAAIAQAEADQAAATKPRSTPTASRSASVVSIPKNARTGQYHYKGRVNSGYIDFLVDTGASAVALTAADARRAGVKESELTYNVPISTAGGRNYAARIKLDQVALGGITLRDVDAFVVPEGLETSLLGMSWLGRLQEVKATPNALLLRY